MFTLNSNRDVIYANERTSLDGVVHVFDAGWHGIRAACGYLPGIKLGISHQSDYNRTDVLPMLEKLIELGAQHIIYQGFSDSARAIAKIIHCETGGELQQHVITHVSPAQFEHHFEMDMISKILELQRNGVIEKVGSVKPGFSSVDENISDVLIVNAPPKLAVRRNLFRIAGEVFVPLENTWRKNLYVNYLGLSSMPEVTKVRMVNHPTYVDLLTDLDKLELTGFLDKARLFEVMSSVGLVSNVTLIECQPMTQLEALAVGTPCLSGPINLPGTEKREFRKLTELTYADDMSDLRKKALTIIEMWDKGGDELRAILDDEIGYRTERALDSYGEFLAE